MNQDPFLEQGWTETNALHTPTLVAALSEQAETLTLTFLASGHRETIQRRDLEVLVRYLVSFAHVDPLPAPDESALEAFQPRRVDRTET
jgi:hypothetical protein